MWMGTPPMAIDSGSRCNRRPMLKNPESKLKSKSREGQDTESPTQVSIKPKSISDSSSRHNTLSGAFLLEDN